MKQRIACVCLLMIIAQCLFSFPVFATEPVTYTLDELGMSIALPSDYVIFTRDISATDPNLSAYGLTKESLSSLMTSRNIYLNAWPQNANYEIIVTMTDNPLKDFNLYSDTILSTMATSLSSEYEALGITYITSEIYQHEQAKFLIIYISQPNGSSTTYGIQYYTVYDGKAINITMQSFSGQISPSNEKMLKNCVNSVVFDTEPQIAETQFIPTSAFTYNDTETQTSFTVPANWVESPLTESREFIDVKFTSIQDYGMTILYSSHDLWKKMTASERAGYTRSDVDNTIFTKSDIAEMYGTTSNNVSMVTYGGTEYFKATITSTNNVYDTNITITINQMIFVDNGYMFSFQFIGTSDTEYYDDFEALLNSVKYRNQEIVRNNTKNIIKFSANNILLSLIVTAALYTLPIIIYRYTIRKEPVDKRKAKKITIIYGIVAVILMVVLLNVINGSGTTGGAIFLWSYINYRILIGGRKTRAESVHHDAQDFVSEGEHLDEIPQAPTAVGTGSCTNDHDQDTYSDKNECFPNPAKSKSRYCHKCGNKLQPDSTFCNRCGTILPAINQEQ